MPIIQVFLLFFIFISLYMTLYVRKQKAKLFNYA